jgi:hypothetical protein
VERLKIAKQASARIPSEEWFTKDLDESAEASVTAAIAKGFSGISGGWCAVEREGKMLCDRKQEASR